MVNDGIIVPVSEPTDWVSRMLFVSKADGDVCIVLYPSNLNNPTKTLTFIACKFNDQKKNVDVKIVCNYNVQFWFPITAHSMFIQ